MTLEGMARKTGLEISDEEARRQPVFIMGVPRSGTTFFFRCLERHPAFHVRADPAGRYSIESNIFTSPGELRGGPAGLNDRIVRFLASNRAMIEEMSKRLEEIPGARPLGSRARFQGWALRLGVMRGHAWKRCDYHHRVRIFFHYSRLARGVHRILEKSPDHALRLPEIWATYPRARVLFLFRHPLNVLGSYRRRWQFDRDQGESAAKLRWMEVSALEFCERYEQSVRQALKWGARRPENFKTLGYERLVSSAEDVLGEVCDFVQEPAEIERMIEGSRDADRGRDWRGLEPSRVDWSQYVDRSESRQIERRLASILDVLKLERYATETRERRESNPWD